MKAYIEYISQRKRSVVLISNALFFAYISYWFYRNINLAGLIAELKQTPPKAILTAMTMNVFVLSFYALRLSAILNGKIIDCFLITNIGFTFNSIMPFRIGEGVKIYFGSYAYNYPVGGLGAAVLMEKLYDLAAILSLSALVATSSGLHIIDFQNFILGAVIIALAFYFILFLRARHAEIIKRLSKWRVSNNIRLDILIKQAELSVVAHSVMRAALFTTLIWLTNVSLVLITFKTLLPGTAFGLFSAMSLLLIAALAIAVPTSPAGLGVVEAGIVSYLTNIYGVQEEKALSAALAYHFSITAPHTLIVIVFLGRSFFRLLKTRPTG